MIRNPDTPASHPEQGALLDDSTCGPATCLHGDQLSPRDDGLSQASPVASEMETVRQAIEQAASAVQQVLKSWPVAQGPDSPWTLLLEDLRGVNHLRQHMTLLETELGLTASRVDELLATVRERLGHALSEHGEKTHGTK